MTTTYKTAKNEIGDISKLKPCYKDVIFQLNERAVSAGFKPIDVEVYNDNSGDPRYAYQRKGLMFRFRFTKDGLKDFWEHWPINAPAFKRGSLSGKPIRLITDICEDENGKNTFHFTYI